MPDSIDPSKASPIARVISGDASPGNTKVEKETAKMTSMTPTMAPVTRAGSSRFGRSSLASRALRDSCGDWDKLSAVTGVALWRFLDGQAVRNRELRLDVGLGCVIVAQQISVDKG